MTQSIVSIEFEIPGHSDNHLSFSADNSLLDYDIIVFAPDISSYLVGEKLFQGNPSLSEHTSFRLKQQVAKWKSGLLNAFNHGKTIFVLMHQSRDLFVDSGRREYSGTGRNERTTTFVDAFKSYSVLPFGFSELVASSGREIRPAAQLGVLASFWSEFSEFCSYEVYFSSDTITPLLSTKTGNKTVGGIIRGASGSKKGAFVLLPKIDYDRDAFTSERGGKLCWNKAGLAWGARFVSSLVKIDKTLRAASATTPPPTWAQSDQYRLASERVTESQIAAITEQIGALETEKEKLRQQLSKDAGLRRLLFETGAELESAILEALGILGLKPSRFRDSDSEFDVTFTWKEHRFLGEAEGKDNKAINVDKISQLERNLNEDFEKEGVSDYAKGILFGNAFRLEEISKRGPFFTEKCMTAAQRLKVALVRTPDLFVVARHVKESGNLEFAEKCVQAMLGANGTVVVFPVPPALPEATQAAAGKN
jgi:hypothetical protein